ncbi:DUF4168 domain-containing protein [Alkalitalea saponilacus]|uniref:DUF4168 domain-containing protein n=1 Tax=Alkalitalea saponilacus TaxID=889453 RepID=A0A1T5DFW0_9BACT|nr:DUF4168 domain-containing protein [Alkalitalea saponilacus]ASB50688.1 DUF4168 domain-containing protein [Alkalitalea saponilacus]SKB70594.1 protein of unknown function [Alkalitalea saponilacus]
MSFTRNQIQKVLASAFMFAFVAMTTNAQQFDMQMPQEQASFSEDQIDQFVNTVVKVIPIQEAAEEKMIDKIEEEGMDLETFNAIATQLQTTGDVQGVDEAEITKFQTISQSLQQIQMEIQSDVMEAIQEEGMDLDLYQGIMAAYQSDPVVRQQIDERLGQMQ